MISPATPLRPTHERNAERPKASVLLVDDSPANLLALEAVLVPLALDIAVARSGEEALLKLLHQDFAVILMDVQMPRLNGLTTARLIKQRVASQHTPIIFLTAFEPDTNEVFKGYAHGAVDYLTKPFVPEILRSKVSVFVDLFSRGEEIKRRESELRRREREALERQNERRFRVLTESMPQWVMAARPDGEIYYSNRPLGAVGSRLAAIPFVHSDDRHRVRACCETALSVGQEFGFECRFTLEDETAHWFLVRAVPERDDDGSSVGWIVTATNIDDNKQTEQRLGDLLVREQDARGAAESANRAKDEFLATVSHELRTPLSAVVGWTQMLRRGHLKEGEVSEALATIERCAKSQLRIIQDIMDVSRATMGKLRLEVGTVSMKHVVTCVIDLLRPAADAKRISVELAVGEGSDTVAGDPARLEQVAWNVIANAIKFTPMDGHVGVSLTRSESCVVLRVCDDGEGIPLEFLPFVFDAFRQADSSSTRVHNGLGLGLAIVKHLVELHGGTVQASSAGPRRGTTLSITLPT